MNYQETYDHSMKDPQDFWAQAAAEIDWLRPWDKVLDDSKAPFYQ